MVAPIRKWDLTVFPSAIFSCSIWYLHNDLFKYAPSVFSDTELILTLFNMPNRKRRWGRAWVEANTQHETEKKSWTSIPVVRWSQFHPSRQVHPENQNHIFGSETPRKIWNIYLKITVTAWDAKMCFRLKKKKKKKYSTNKELLLPGKKKGTTKNKNQIWLQSKCIL